MFGISLDELLLIFLVMVIIIKPEKWLFIVKKTGYLFGKYKKEMEKLKSMFHSKE